jgi:hypothetical protein
MNNEDRISEIKEQLTNEQHFIDFLCSLPDDRYSFVFGIMKLAKLLEQQMVSSSDIKSANDVRTIYAIKGIVKTALMAFIYGKIQGKREERAKK